MYKLNNVAGIGKGPESNSLDSEVKMISGYVLGYKTCLNTF